MRYSVDDSRSGAISDYAACPFNVNHRLPGVARSPALQPSQAPPPESRPPNPFAKCHARASVVALLFLGRKMTYSGSV